MKKIPAEVKVGAIALATILVFIWLYSFLKGQNLFSSTERYHVLYENISGLETSSPVEINGYQVGVVQNVHLMNDGSGKIVVTIGIDRGTLLPENSVAEITTASLIAGMKIIIDLGPGPGSYSNGDTIPGRLAVSILDKMESNFDPIIARADSLVASLDLFISSLSGMMNENFRNDIQDVAGNMSGITSNVDMLLDNREKEIEAIISDLNRFTTVLANNENKIDSAISNLALITDSLAGADLPGSFRSLRSTLDETSMLLGKLNEGEGSAGKLLSDDSLYINLSNSLNSLDLLLNDMRENPGRYVRFSLFGGKKE